MQVAGIDAAAGRVLMVDVTTTLAEAGRIAHGTTRVERGIVGGLLACDPAGLSFCRFDRARQRFVDVPRDELRRRWQNSRRLKPAGLRRAAGPLLASP